MQDLVIYGAGGFGRETALMVKQINTVKPQWNLIGFCDDGKKEGEIVDGLPVAGGVDYLNSRKSTLAVSLAIANPMVRMKIRHTIHNPHIHFPVLVHPSANLGDLERNRLGEGCIVTAGNILTTNVHLDPFVIINLACTIGHDVRLGAFTSVMPGCSLSGFVIVEQGVLIGTGARILPQLILGEGSRVGAGAVVTRSVAAGTTVVGVPAKPQGQAPSF